MHSRRIEYAFKAECGGQRQKQQPPKKKSVETVSGCPPWCIRKRLGIQAPVFKARTLRKWLNHEESDFINGLVHSLFLIWWVFRRWQKLGGWGVEGSDSFSCAPRAEPFNILCFSFSFLATMGWIAFSTCFYHWDSLASGPKKCIQPVMDWSSKFMQQNKPSFCWVDFSQVPSCKDRQH